MPHEVWERLDALAQRYPVILYASGHSHYFRTEGRAPGYVAHSSASVASDFKTLYVLRNGRVNIQPLDMAHADSLDTYAPVAIVSPYQYHAGLDYTRTPAGPVTIEAHIRTSEGALKRAYYQLDGGPEVTMARVGDSDLYAAPLDASALSGLHNIEVVGDHVFGFPAADGRQTMAVFFAEHVPKRPLPAGCACGE